jgi:hypothetical protein
LETEFKFHSEYPTDFRSTQESFFKNDRKIKEENLKKFEEYSKEELIELLNKMQEET